MAEKLLNFVGLLDGDADSDGIHGTFDQYSFFLVSADHYRVEEKLLRRSANKNATKSRLKEGNETLKSQ